MIRDPITINAICWMIHHRQLVEDIPDTCGGQLGLIPEIRRILVDGNAAFDEETESLSDADDVFARPDWDALSAIVLAFCLAKDSQESPP